MWQGLCFILIIIIIIMLTVPSPPVPHQIPHNAVYWLPVSWGCPMVSVLSLPLLLGGEGGPHYVHLPHVVVLGSEQGGGADGGGSSRPEE